MNIFVVSHEDFLRLCDSFSVELRANIHNGDFHWYIKNFGNFEIQYPDKELGRVAATDKDINLCWNDIKDLRGLALESYLSKTFIK